ncbi:NAD(P)H-dependent flavin oxidoreductase [Macrococcus animalis]|uniref:NAD(P)H-dependent flavin oxidoreductase n=1 Tax=Macrococcus animalis TaxID=3395467 RepID=UPI0039BEB36E
MWQETRFSKHIGIQYPIVQAGMAGSTTPELVAAVSNEGGLGTIGAGYMTLDILRQEIETVRNLTNKPFAVNLFVPETFEENTEDVKKVQEQLQPYYDQYNLDTANVQSHPESEFINKLQLLMNMKVPVISFTFGIPDKTTVNQLKAQGIITIATAGSVEEATEIEHNGFDMVVAQGHEAGGHKGSYKEARGIGTMALIPQVVDNVSIPVIAAGGIMDARGVLAAITLGASGVQMGTAFLTTNESKAPSVHKEAIIHAQPRDTTITKVFSGKSARGIENKIIRDLESSDIAPLPYPLQNDLTTSIRKSAASAGDTDYLHMWCGQAPMLAKKMNAQALFRDIVSHVDNMILDLTASKS